MLGMALSLSMADKETGGPQLPQAVRARLLRRLVEGDDRGAQTRFAKKLGIDYNRWNNFERGSPISREIEDLLASSIPGLTVDFVRRGARGGLSVALSAALDALEAADRRHGRAS